MPAPHIRPSSEADEAPALVAIWCSAVDATHEFLRAEDRAAIEEQLAQVYFPQVELVVATLDDRPVGFAGVAGTSLEMLFVHADARGRGIGRALLSHVITTHDVRTVDVNEQNQPGVGFYRHQGFTVVGRSALDGQGRPYPLLHLVRCDGAGRKRD